MMFRPAVRWERKGCRWCEGHAGDPSASWSGEPCPDVSNMATGSCLDPEPENAVLLNNKSRTVKLIDFRLSRRAMPGTEVRKMLRTTEFLSPEAQLRGGVGLCGNV